MGRVKVRPDEQESANITFYAVLKRSLEEGELKDVLPVKGSPKLREPRQKIEKTRCPYCYALLAGVPGRKKRCPFCSSTVYRRRQPEGSGYVLVTAEQIKEATLVSKYRKQLTRLTQGKKTKAPIKLKEPGRIAKEKTMEEIITRLEKHRERLQAEVESIEVCSWWFPKALHNRYKQLNTELKSLDEHITELKKPEGLNEGEKILPEENSAHSWF